MVLNTPYLASEEPAARRSRALRRFTVASPLVLLLSVGLVGHVRKAPSPQPAESVDYDRRVLAYGPRVAAVRSLLAQGAPPEADVRREAGRWVAGRRSGALAPLPPAYFEDHLQGGVRGEVFRSGIALSSILAARAARAREEGQVERASADALLSAQLARGVRDFESQTLLQALLVQRRATTLLIGLWPGRSARRRTADASALRSLLVPRSDVARLRALELRQFEDYQRRQKIAPKVADHQGRFLDSLEERQAHALDRSVSISNASVRQLLAP